MSTLYFTTSDSQAVIQAALNALTPGQIHTANFADGTYAWDRGQSDSLLDLPRHLGPPGGLTVNFSSGVILRANGGQTTLAATPEIAFGIYDVGVGLNDLSAQFSATLNPTSYSRVLNVIVSIASVAPANGGSVDKFTLTGGSGATNVDITPGVWQDLGSQNMQIMFASGTGHTVGDKWYVYPTVAVPLHGVRIGTGYHENYVDGIVINGNNALIDMQYVAAYAGSGNIQPHSSAQEIAANLFIHGRVRAPKIKGLRYQGYDRPVMHYGEHTGKKLSAGARGPGISYDCDQVAVTGCVDLGTSAQRNTKWLGGHPSHRGRSKRFSWTDSSACGFEPNFRAWRADMRRAVLYGAAANGSATLTSWRHGCQNDYVDIVAKAGAISDSSPNGWPTPILSTRRNLTTDAAASETGTAWADPFPTGWTQRMPLTIASTLFVSAPGTFYLPIFNASLLTAIGGATGGADIRASYDTAGALQIPVKRILDTSGGLVGLGLGITINQIATDTTVYIWRGGSTVTPPQAETYGAYSAEFDGTLIFLSGDADTNDITSRSTTTGATLGSGYTFTGTQSELCRDVLDDDTRLMANGLLLGCWATVGTGGRTLFSYGTLTLWASSTAAFATFGNQRVSASFTNGNHIAVRLIPPPSASPVLQLLVGGAVVASATLTNQHTRDQSLRIAGPREGYGAVVNGDATLDDIMVIERAPSVAAIAGYVAVAKGQGSLTVGAAVTL